MNQILSMPRKRLQFNIIREKCLLQSIMPNLPTDTVYKMVSYGGFSSIAFIRYISDACGINVLYASTLAVGKKHLACLDVMHQQGKLKEAHFIVGKIMQQGKQEQGYGYFKTLQSVCKKNDWTVDVANNHSKLLLFDTPRGKFVLETSSNLNENPNMEHFSFEKSAELYNFYLKIFEG